MTNEKKQYYINKGFSDELEKLGAAGAFKALATLAKNFLPKLKAYGTAVQKSYNTGGMKGLNKYVQTHGTNRFVKNQKGKITLVKPVAIKEETGMLQKAVGNFAKGISDVSRMQGVTGVGKITQFGKNIYNTGKRSLVSSQYKVVDEKNLRKVFKNRKNNLRYKGPIGSRPIVGGNKSNGYIIPKYKINRAAAAVATPVGFGAQEVAFDRSPGGAAKGVKEFATWQFAKPYAGAKLMKDIFFTN